MRTESAQLALEQLDDLAIIHFAVMPARQDTRVGGTCERKQLGSTRKCVNRPDRGCNQVMYTRRKLQLRAQLCLSIYVTFTSYLLGSSVHWR